MYTLIKTLTTRQLFVEQLPTMVAALAVAEFFYKFHSFLLEVIAFLATWFVFDAVASRLFARLRTASGSQ